MAKSGRELLLKKGGVTIGGIQTKSIGFGNERVEVGNDDSGGFATALEKSAEKIISLSANGVTNSYVLRDLASDPSGSVLVTDLSITFPVGTAGKTVITGDFFMANYEETGDYKDSIKWSATFTSSGAWARA